MQEVATNLTLKTAPEFLPITMQIAKKQLKMEGVEDDDDLIEIQLGSATELVEVETRRALMKQIWNLHINDWHAEIVVGGKNPVQSIQAVKYVDVEGEEQTLDVDQYQFVNSGPSAKIYFNGDALPELEDDNYDRIKIELICGYSASASESVQQAAVPKPIKSAILLKLASLYEGREDRKSELQTRASLMLVPYTVSFF